MSPNHDSENPARSSTSSFAQSISCLYLTLNSITTIYRAYINNDMPMVAFIIFVYLGYFILDYCVVIYNRLPSKEESPKKEFLKVTIWGLSSAIFFGFSYQFSTFMSLFVVVPMYGFAIVSSVFLFYFYFLRDNNHSGCNSEILQSSCAVKNDNKSGVSTFENV
ncbi:hypothetical protein P3X46_032399 [Hevea brasiliensis]|uniref:Uncharacterized protein n=1 Tax=Hevea brasiliensis TaxID=3981 RepID=A0ABQ9KD72_HEVBR|nr:hypothetical protein P3X46_032399 [Hevea brasiliensis]